MNINDFDTKAFDAGHDNFIKSVTTGNPMPLVTHCSDAAKESYRLGIAAAKEEGYI